MFPATAMAATYPKCNSVAAAGKVIREALLARDTTAHLSYSFTTSDYDKTMKSLDKQFFEEAVKHTGKPTEGDYLRWQYGSYSRYNTGYRTGDKYNVDITYTIKYYTSASEEAEISSAVRKILASLHLEDKDDYNVVKSIYDFVTKNISYDADAVKNLDMKAFTPYKAIIDPSHKAVCQGYSLLLYRMLLECGIDCRIIAADNGGKNPEDGHAWNYIKLGDKYYIADSTWDSKKVHNGQPYKFFLCGSKDFKEHEKYSHVHDYIKNHPTAATKYNANSQPTVKAFRKTTVRSLSSSKSGSKAVLTAKWYRRYGIKGYQVQYGLKKDYDSGKATIKTIDSNSTTSTTIGKLKKGKKYYVRVRTFKKVGGKTYHSAWSNKKSVTLK